MRKTSSHWHEAGFTLVEILVVMVIIGILASLIAGNFVGTRLKARDSRRKNDLQQIQRALEAYQNDYGRYPDANANGQIVVNGTALEWGASSFQDEDNKGTVYMATLPGDPSGALYKYVYVSMMSRQAYQIFAYLENNRDNDVTTGTFFPDCNASGAAVECNWGVSSSNTNIYSDPN